MNENSFNFNNTFIHSVLLIILLIISISNQSYGQSTIYKKDGTTIKAYNLDKQGTSRSYSLLNDTTGVIYYISWEAMDSIRYADGTMERFNSEIILPGSIIPIKKEGKNLIGFNIWPLFTGYIDILYDRKISDYLGLKTTILFRPSGVKRTGSYYNSTIYSIGSGINYYFLQSDLFRFGTGAALNFTQFNFFDYYEYDQYQYHEYYKKKNMANILINASFTVKIVKVIFSSLEVDVPLLRNYPYHTLVKTEVAINF